MARWRARLRLSRAVAGETAAADEVSRTVAQMQASDSVAQMQASDSVAQMQASDSDKGDGSDT